MEGVCVYCVQCWVVCVLCVCVSVCMPCVYNVCGFEIECLISKSEPSFHDTKRILIVLLGADAEIFIDCGWNFLILFKVYF